MPCPRENEQLILAYRLLKKKYRGGVTERPSLCSSVMIAFGSNVQNDEHLTLVFVLPAINTLPRASTLRCKL